MPPTTAIEDQDLATYAAELALDETRLIREVTSKRYAPRIREDFKAGVRAGVNGTPYSLSTGSVRRGAGSKTSAQRCDFGERLVFSPEERIPFISFECVEQLFAIARETTRARAPRKVADARP